MSRKPAPRLVSDPGLVSDPVAVSGPGPVSDSIEIVRRRVPESPLPETDERLTPGRRGQTEIEHFHRYLAARSFCAGLDVLDVASGEGYGAGLIGEVAASVVGLEIDGVVVAHAVAAHGSSKVRFVQGDAQSIPLPDDCVDVVVSFETIEHLADQESFLREVKRVLRPRGLLIVSTPDKALYSSPDAPPNPFHLKELSRPEFGELLGRHFAATAFARQRAMVGSVVLLEERGRGGFTFFERIDESTFEVSRQFSRAAYILALATDGDLPDLDPSLYVETGDLLAYDLKLENAMAREREMRAERGLLTAELERLRSIQGASSTGEASSHAMNLLAASRDEMARRLDELLLRLAKVEDDRLSLVRDADAKASASAVTAGVGEALVESLAAERDRLARLVSELREAHAAVLAEAADNHARAQVLDAQLAERTDRYAEQARRASALETRAYEDASRAEIATATAESLRERLSGELIDLRIALAAARSEAGEREKALEAMRAALIAGERRVTDLETRLRELQARLIDAVADASVARTQVAERERAAEAQKLGPQVDALVADLSAALARNHEDAQTRDTLRVRLTELEEERALQDERHAESESRAAVLVEDIAELRSELAAAERREIDSAETIDRLRSELDEEREQGGAVSSLLFERDRDLAASLVLVEDLSKKLAAIEEASAGREETLLRDAQAAAAERDSMLRLLRQQRLVHARLHRELIAARDIRASAFEFARRSRLARFLPASFKRMIKRALFRGEGRV